MQGSDEVEKARIKVRYTSTCVHSRSRICRVFRQRSFLRPVIEEPVVRMNHKSGPLWPKSRKRLQPGERPRFTHFRWSRELCAARSTFVGAGQNPGCRLRGGAGSIGIVERTEARQENPSCSTPTSDFRRRSPPGPARSTETHPGRLKATPNPTETIYSVEKGTVLPSLGPRDRETEMPTWPGHSSQEEPRAEVPPQGGVRQ